LKLEKGEKGEKSLKSDAAQKMDGLQKPCGKMADEKEKKN